MRWPTRFGRSRRQGGRPRLPPGTVELPPLVAHGLLVVAEQQRLEHRRALIPGAPLPEGATLRAARRSGLHPSVDPIGLRAHAALEAWRQLIGDDTPEVVAAWAGDDTATILLAGPVDPQVGVPKTTATVMGLRVSFQQYGTWKPNHLSQLVLAEITGPVPPGLTPDRTWAADGLLLPFGSTRGGVLYLPLLGTTEAGPLAISGPAAPEFLSSLLVFAMARVGIHRARALVYQDMLDLLDGLIEAETFGPAELHELRLRLKEEWKQRTGRMSEAGAENLQSYALLPDVEPIPLLLLLLGPQAATEMGLLDLDWPYVLREGARAAIPILVWGDVATAPRRVEVAPQKGSVSIAGRSDIVEYDIGPVEFTPTLLSPEIRNEVVAILRGAEPTAGISRSAERADGARPILDTTIAPEPVEAAPSKSAVQERPGERRLFLLGGVRAEHAGQAIERWRRRDALELLAFLAAHPEGRSTDAVLEAIWAEAHAARARTHLRQLVREARVRLAGDLVRAPIVLFRDGIYRLDWENLWVDAQVFRQLITRARAAADPAPHLHQAVTLYRGEFCKDAYYSWTEPARQELERLYLDAVIRLADLQCDRGADEEAHSLIDTALNLNPYVDTLVQRAIVLDAQRLGVRVAQERFRSFRARLREDLGADPDAATVAAFERLMRNRSTDS